MSVLDLAITSPESPVSERVESGELAGTVAQSPSYPLNLASWRLIDETFEVI